MKLDILFFFTTYDYKISKGVVGSLHYRPLRNKNNDIKKHGIENCNRLIDGPSPVIAADKKWDGVGEDFDACCTEI